MEAIQLVHSPVNAARHRQVSTSTTRPFGVAIPCPGDHQYCQECLVFYIKLKIDPNGDGRGNPNTIVFPIVCPGCSIADEGGGLTDEIASRILSEKDFQIWVCIHNIPSAFPKLRNMFSAAKGCLIAVLGCTALTSNVRYLFKTTRIPLALKWSVWRAIT